MKNTITNYIIFFLALILVFSVQESAAKFGTKVRICAVKGTVQTGSAIEIGQNAVGGNVYTCPLKQTLNKTECRIVTQETMIETGPNGYGYIEYQDGIKAKVGPNTKLVVSGDNIYVQNGITWFKVEKMSYGEIVIKTPTAIAGIRGTEFLVNVENDGSSTIQLIEGSIEVTDINKQSKMMFAAGMEVEIPANSSTLNTGLLNIQENDEWWTDWPTLVPITEMPGYKGDPVSVNISGNSNLPIADSHVYAYSYLNWNKANWGKYEVLGAGWHPTGGEKRAYLKFDVSGIDKESFNKAVLRLYHYHTAGSNSSELGVYTVRSAWNEGDGTYNPTNVASPNELCWINQPTIDPYPVAYFNPGANPNKFVEVDITALVKSWLNGMPNYGLAIKTGENYMGGSESVYGFYSREYEDVSKRPQLIINGNAAGASLASGNVGSETQEEATNELSAVLGKWRWISNDVFTFTKDGKCFKNETNEQAGTISKEGDLFVIKHNNGYTDKISLSADGKLLDGKNQNGSTVAAYRIEPDFGSAITDVYGIWKWTDGRVVNVTVDGDLLVDGKKTGTFTKNGDEFTFKWNNGYTDVLKHSPNHKGTYLTGHNQNGTFITARRDYTIFKMYKML